MVRGSPTKDTLGQGMDRLFPASGGVKDRSGRENEVPPANSKRPKEVAATSDARRVRDLPKSETDLLVATRREGSNRLTPILAGPVQTTH